MPFSPVLRAWKIKHQGGTFSQNANRETQREQFDDYGDEKLLKLSGNI
jgi:hypothetical protein